MAAGSNGTRGVWGGGRHAGDTDNDAIDYVNIASTGNASDFGNLAGDTFEVHGCSDNTKTVFVGGSISGSPINVLQYINTASTGNSIDFGDLLATTMYCVGMSNGTRGIGGGGYTGSTVNVIQFWVMASLGNASDFGDLSIAKSEMGGGATGD